MPSDKKNLTPLLNIAEYLRDIASSELQYCFWFEKRNCQQKLPAFSPDVFHECNSPA